MNNNSILIDRYLQNEMSAAERTAFENQLITDNELQEELQLQQLITKAATTAGVKNEFAKAIRKKIIAQRLIKLGIAVVVVASVLFYALKNNWFSHYAAVSKTENSTNEKFEIDNVADTIIETKDGVVFVIPAHAFNTSSNNVRLEIKTALNAYDIMQNGLSTMSNEAMLQTAGMFYINGFDGDKVLTLTKEIAVSVPADTINTNMQLFDGIKDSSGRINWLNPKLIEKGLRTYDITTLDFYPPKYIPTLKVLGKDYLNKNYTDSLYYSFIDYSGIADQSMPKPGEKPGTDYPYNNQIADTSINLDFLADSIPRIKKDFSCTNS